MTPSHWAARVRTPPPAAGRSKKNRPRAVSDPAPPPTPPVSSEMPIRSTVACTSVSLRVAKLATASTSQSLVRVRQLGKKWSCTLSESDQANSSGGRGCVADRSVLLESPALPVSEGAAVTLRCRIKLNSSSRTFHFYRDGSKVHSSSDGEMMFPHTSKSDEGLYKCSAAGGEESESSWLAVQGDTLERTSKQIFFPSCSGSHLSLLHFGAFLYLFVYLSPNLIFPILLKFCLNLMASVSLSSLKHILMRSKLKNAPLNL